MDVSSNFLREVSLFSIVIFAVFFSQSAHGALLYLDPMEADIYRGDTVTLSLRIDVDPDECINTIDGVIKYDPAVRAVDVSRGSSILSLWVESPNINESERTITFAGGIPGGYCGRVAGDPGLTNEIVKLIFRSPGFAVGGNDAKQARVWIDEMTQVYLHDGQGTRAPLETQNALIRLYDTAGSVQTDEWASEVRMDIDPPTNFLITLTKDDTAFSGRYFITFNTTDKQSGISHYEVMEEPFSEFYTFKWGRANAPWIRAESPYVLLDQTLNSTIRVKAVDKAGNERIEVLVPDVAQRSLSQDRLISLILIGFAVVLVVGLIAFAFWKRSKKVYEHEEKL